MPQSYSVPLKVKLRRPLTKAVFRFLFRLLGRVKISGLENLPAKQGYVVAMNHISIFDPPFVVSFWPHTPEIIGSSEVFHKRGQGFVLKTYGVIPVHRGEYDRVVMDTMLSILQADLPLIIAPEGSRSHVPGLLPAMPGVGYIIEHSGAAVVPVGIAGTTDDYWKRSMQGERPTIEMRVGKPIHFPPMTEKGAERREARQRYSDTVMNHIAGLLPPEYRGAYTNTVILPS